MQKKDEMIIPVRRLEKDELEVPVKVVESASGDPEKKIYVLLLWIKGSVSGESFKEWESITGRTATRDYIKNMIENIDVHESFILVEGLPFNDSKSVYDVMKMWELLYDDGFDIEDYNY